MPHPFPTGSCLALIAAAGYSKKDVAGSLVAFNMLGVALTNAFGASISSFV
jgi:hypothetical protein